MDKPAFRIKKDKEIGELTTEQLQLFLQSRLRDPEHDEYYWEPRSGHGYYGLEWDRAFLVALQKFPTNEFYSKFKQAFYNVLCEDVLMMVYVEALCSKERIQTYDRCMKLWANYYYAARDWCKDYVEDEIDKKMEEIIETLICCRHYLMTRKCNSDDKVDMYFRTLCVVLANVSMYDLEFWKSVFYSEDGRYATPAFGAILKQDLDQAIELIPQFIAAYARHQIGADFYLYFILYKNMENKELLELINSKIDFALEEKSDEVKEYVNHARQNAYDIWESEKAKKEKANETSA